MHHLKRIPSLRLHRPAAARIAPEATPYLPRLCCANANGHLQSRNFFSQSVFRRIYSTFSDRNETETAAEPIAEIPGVEDSHEQKPGATVTTGATKAIEGELHTIIECATPEPCPADKKAESHNHGSLLEDLEHTLGPSMGTNPAMGGESQSPKAPSPMEVADLPPLPPRQGKNTPHIYRSDIDTYLHPLISHRWTIGHVHKGQGIREVLSLNKHFEFSSFAAAMEFVNGVAAISESERHHARTLIEYKTVVTFLHTHSAHIDFGIPGGKPNLRKVPGLTRRDIRLAIKIEQLHDEFMADGRAAPYAFRALGVLQKWACQLLKRRYGSDGFGGAAGSQPPFQKMIERMKARGEWNPLLSSHPVLPTIDPGENDPGAKPVR